MCDAEVTYVRTYRTSNPLQKQSMNCFNATIWLYRIVPGVILSRHGKGKNWWKDNRRENIEEEEMEEEKTKEKKIKKEKGGKEMKKEEKKEGWNRVAVRKE